MAEDVSQRRRSKKRGAAKKAKCMMLLRVAVAWMRADATLGVRLLDVQNWRGRERSKRVSEMLWGKEESAARAPSFVDELMQR